MIVLDASAWIDWLLPERRSAQLIRTLEPATAVHVLDFTPLEVLSTLRRFDRLGALTITTGPGPVDVVRGAPYIRNPAIMLADRIWDLRNTHSAWDAAYVALAEALECPLITTDRRLARSNGHGATIIDCSEDA